MSRSTRSPITRRRFVGLVAAGGATVAAGLAATARAGSAGDASAVDAGTPSAKDSALLTPAQKEFERQKAGTLTTLKTLREFPLPPGGDLAVVFRPLKTRESGREPGPAERHHTTARSH